MSEGPQSSDGELTDHATSLLQVLNQQRLEQEFCDVTLILEDQEFPCHRCVLSAASPYFHAMFAGGMLESRTARVNIHDVPSPIFAKLLRFIYTGGMEVCEETCEPLALAASMLQVAGALHACARFLTQHLHPSNALGVGELGERLGCAPLFAASQRFVHEHFSDVCAHREFQHLPLEALRALLGSEEIQVESEAAVLEAAMCWVRADLPARRHCARQALERVRLPVIDPGDLRACLRDCAEPKLRATLQTMLQELEHAGALRDSGRAQLFRPRRRARQHVYVVGGYSREEGERWSDSHSLSTAECFHTFTQQWGALPSMQLCRSGHGLCALDGRVYAVGGENDSLIFDSAECFHPKLNRWEYVAPLTMPRCGLGVVALEGYIYALGGWVGADIGRTMEKYDPGRDRWEELGPVPTPRFAMGLAAHNGELYAVGGLCEQSNELALLERYSPAFGEWRALPRMSERRAFVGAAALGDCVYAVGGWNEQQGALASVERYRVTKGEWESVASLQQPRAGACISAVNGQLWAVGGRKSFRDPTLPPVTLTSIEVYDPATNTWTPFPHSLPTGRCEAGVAVL